MKKDTQFPHQLQIAKNMHEELRDLVNLRLRGAALGLIQSLFNEEVERLCGHPFERKNDLFHRGGSEKGNVILQGQRLAVKRPRMRSNKGEVPLENYE
jgi:transposase-like protein